MKYRKLQILSILLIGLFFLSSSGNVKQTSATSYIETNFELWYFTSSGSRIMESTALYFKQALAPLGIDVKIIAKPFGQFIGDLFHETTGHPFDLAEIRFGGGAPTPTFNFAYHTQGSFGADMYQIHDTDWQAWQEIDTGVIQSEVDDMIDAIRFELDTVKRMELTREFAQLYMEKLLYDYPTTSRSGLYSMWRGFGGVNSENWDIDESWMNNIAMGNYWEYNPDTRVGDATTLNLQQSTPQKEGNFDPMQSFDQMTSFQTNWLWDNIVFFDKLNIPHPGIAYQWLLEDYDNGTDIIEAGKHTWFFRDDAMWPATTDWEGNVIPGEPVDAYDYLFALDIIVNYTHTVVNGKESYVDLDADNPYFSDIIIKQTVTPADTVEIYLKKDFITIDDGIVYNWNNPMPTHILGGDLHYYNNTEDEWTNGTAADMTEAGLNPQQSEEWLHFADEDGVALVGPYSLGTFTPGETIQFEARDDYYFPNEWDTKAIYTANKAIFDAAYPDYDMGIFAPHINAEEQPAKFFAYDSDETARVKPAALAIQDIKYVRVDDTNAALLMFDAGQVDQFASYALGTQQVSTHKDNTDIVQQNEVPGRGPETHVYNLLNPHLKKYNVRRAIAHAIDRDVLVKIWNGFALDHESVVWANSPGYYAITTEWGIPYSYESARDLMREEGYAAAESNEPDAGTPSVPIATVIDTLTGQVGEVVEEITESLGSELWIGITGFAVLAVSLIRRRK